MTAIGQVDPCGHLVTGADIGTVGWNGQIVTGAPSPWNNNTYTTTTYNEDRTSVGRPLLATQYAPVATVSSGVITVPLILAKQGSRFQFPDSSYTLALERSKLQRDEFSRILDELNYVCQEYSPNMGGGMMCLAMVPCTGICTILTWKTQMANLEEQLQRTCNAINKHNGGRGINLRYRNGLPYGRGGTPQVQVDIEVVV